MTTTIELFAKPFNSTASNPEFLMKLEVMESKNCKSLGFRSHFIYHHKLLLPVKFIAINVYQNIYSLEALSCNSRNAKMQGSKIWHDFLTSSLTLCSFKTFDYFHILYSLTWKLLIFKYKWKPKTEIFLIPTHV